MQVKRALISVFHKEGVVEFARELIELGFEIVSSGGTARVLREANIPVAEVSEITGYPAILEHRVVTLHPAIHGGILAKRTEEHEEELKKYQIKRFNLVCVDLYPVLEEIKKEGVNIDAVMEKTDIGGPTLIRGAAKNHNNGITVICDPADRQKVLDELKEKGEVSDETRLWLAQKVFQLMSTYDAAIADFMNLQRGILNFRQFFTEGQASRYGENPHQRGWLYIDPLSSDPLALWKFQQLQGKEMSFNNYLDLSAAVDALVEITVGGFEDKHAGIIVKHQNPSGAAISYESLQDAYLRAWYDGDPLASFGGIMVVNGEVDKELARMMIRTERDVVDKFFEVLAAPSITEEAKEVFAKKKNLRVLVNPALAEQIGFAPGMDFKRVRGGILIQDIDRHIVREEGLLVVTEVNPTPEQIRDLLFAWRLAKASKSNTIVIAKDQTLIASGVGQQDRMRCCRLVVSKAGERAKGCVAASDAFFPFNDGPKVLIEAGVTAIIQPGGSLRDQDTIDACNEAGIAMVYTSKDPKNNMIRCFRH